MNGEVASVRPGELHDTYYDGEGVSAGRGRGGGLGCQYRKRSMMDVLV